MLSLAAIAPLTELTRPSTTPTRSQQNNKAAQAAEPAVAPAAPRAACARRGESSSTSSRLSSLLVPSSFLFSAHLSHSLSLTLGGVETHPLRLSNSPSLLCSSSFPFLFFREAQMTRLIISTHLFLFLSPAHAPPSSFSSSTSHSRS